MKVLITGGTGFIGRHLVLRIKRDHPDAALFIINRSGKELPGATTLTADAKDPLQTDSLIKQLKPDQVFHLAGISRVSSEIPFPTLFEENFLTTVNLFRGLAQLDTPTKLFFASSAHVYGNQTEEVSEASSAKPVSEYGFTKLLAENYLKSESTDAENIQLIVGRLDSCLGPGQSTGFVAADFARKLSSLGEDADASVTVGGLEGKRHFLDVRDAVRFIVDLVNLDALEQFEVFNIASPNAKSVNEVFQLLVEISGKQPRIVTSKEIATNQFAGVSVNIKKLEESLKGSYFTDLKTTLRDQYKEASEAGGE